MSYKEKIFMDLEFDYYNGYPEILSIGAVKCDKKYNTLNKFYTITKPLKRKKISKAVKELTGLNEDIIKERGKELSTTLNELLEWIGEDKIQIFVWGNEDKRVLYRAIKTLNATDKYNSICRKMIDIQPSLCKTIFNTDRIFSLEKMKYLYNIEGNVKHEALSDAIDLMSVCKKYKTTKIDNERLTSIYSKAAEKLNDYTKKFKLLINYLNTNYSGELKFNTKNRNLQEYLANNFHEAIEIPNFKGLSNTIYLTSEEESLHIYYYYNHKNYCLKISNNSIDNFKDFYCKLNEAIEEYFIENITPQKININELNELNENEKEFLIKYKLINSNNHINTNFNNLPVSYVSLDYKSKHIELLNDQKECISAFYHNFNKEDVASVEMINKFSGVNNINSRCINLNEELLNIIEQSFDKNLVYLDKDKSKLNSKDNFHSDIKELSKKNITLSVYGKAKFHINNNIVTISRTKGDKDSVELYLTDENKDLLIEYLIDLAKNKKNKHLNISREFLSKEAVSLKCNNQRFSSVIKNILDNEHNKNRYSYKINGDEIVISDNFSTNNLNHINTSITLPTHFNGIFYLVLHNSFISRKYILDNCTHDIFKSIFIKYAREKWLSSGTKIVPLSKNTKKLLGKIYRENELRKNLNNKDINLIIYEFNNSVFILLNNKEGNTIKKVHLKNKRKIKELKEIFPELNIYSI